MTLNIKDTLPILTPRLIIDLPSMDMRDEIQAAKIEIWPELQKWMSWSTPDQKAIKPLRDYLQSASDPNIIHGFPLIGRCRETDQYVVSTGLHPVEGKENEFSTGYWVAKNMQGKGLATEATNAVLRYAFDIIGVDKMHICYYEGNLGSRRVIEKLGFTATQTLKNNHKSNFDGSMLDEHLFEMHSPEVLPALDVKFG